MKTKILIYAFLLLTLLSPSAAIAQDASTDLQEQGFSINPAIVDVSADKNKTTTHSFRLQTNGDTPIPVIIEAKSLIPIDNELDQSRRSEFDASSWIKLINNSYILEPDKSVEVGFEITVPKNANPGGHYATINITALPVNQQTSTTSTQIVPQIGVSVFITVPGNVIERAELDTSSLIAKQITRGDDATLSFLLKNPGNVHILTSPKITIYKGDELIEAFSLQPQVVLPNTQKRFEATWNSETPLGKYTARVELVYGNDSIPLASPETVFTVIPPLFQLIGFGFSGLVILLILIRIKHLPKIIHALQGKAHAAPKRFKTFSGKSSLERPVGELTPPDEVVAALKVEKPILGLPEYGRVEITPEEIEELEVDIDLKNVAPEKPITVSKTIVENGTSITHIVQTKSSTIVREVTPPKPAQPEVSPMPSKAKRILVIDHQETENAKVAPIKTISKQKKKSTSSKKKQI